jgi:hypothetical protein
MSKLAVLDREKMDSKGTAERAVPHFSNVGPRRANARKTFCGAIRRPDSAAFISKSMNSFAMYFSGF